QERLDVTGGGQLPPGDRGPRCGQVAGQVTDRGEVDLQGAVGPGAGSSLAGTVAVVQLSVAEAGRGCTERRWCLADTPAAAGRGGLAGGVGRQREAGAGEERLKCPGERAGGGEVR